MRLDCTKYRINIPAIKSMLEDKTIEERQGAIGMVSLATGVPIIVVTCYVIELWGSYPILDAYLARLVDFYGIKEIRGRKDVQWAGKGHSASCICSECLFGV